MPCDPDGRGSRHSSQLERRLRVGEQRRHTAHESELILLLNSDTIVPRESGSAHCRAARAARRVDCRAKDRRRRRSTGAVVRPHDDAAVRAAAEAAPPLRVATPPGSDDLEDAQVDWVTRRVPARSPRDAEAAGLLDERYFMYCEDVDFCAAVRANGGTCTSPRSHRSSTCAAVRGDLALRRRLKPTAGASSRSTGNTTADGRRF
jgi:hypothetical protein